MESIKRNAVSFLPNVAIELTRIETKNSHMFCQIEYRYCDLPSNTVSTISISFSPDGTCFASSHGDHTVKIISYPEGRVVQVLRGHPRTPWAVKFHPTNKHIVASGCLAFQVRVWDLRTGRTTKRVVVDKHVVSLDFHPIESILAISSVHQIFMWKYDSAEAFDEVTDQDAEAGDEDTLESNANLVNVLEAKRLRSMRCVKFLPSGRYVITGQTNLVRRCPMDRRGNRHNRLSTVELVLWRFESNISSFSTTRDFVFRARLHDPILLAPRALLYNDGGFAISSDAKVLAVCLGDVANPENDSGEDDDDIVMPLSFPIRHHPHASGSATGGRSEVQGGTTITTRISDLAVEGDSEGDSPGLAMPPLRRRRGVGVGLRIASAIRLSSNDMDVESSTTRSDPLAPPRLCTTPERRSRNGQERNPRPVRRRRLDLGRSRGSNLRRARGPFLDESEAELSFHLAIISLTPSSSSTRVFVSAPIDIASVRELTSVKLSPSRDYVLLGFQQRERVNLPFARRGDADEDRRIAEIYRAHDMKKVTSIRRRHDDINIAVFHPYVANGFVYGTKQGKVCIAQRDPSGFENSTGSAPSK
eukprot:g513.t1